MEPRPLKPRVLHRVLLQASHHLGVPADTLVASTPVMRVVDSLDETNFILAIEAEFGVSLSDEAIAAYRARRGNADMTFEDIAELVLERWGTDPAATARRRECRACGYPVGDIGTNTCPECGATFF